MSDKNKVKVIETPESGIRKLTNELIAVSELGITFGNFMQVAHKIESVKNLIMIPQNLKTLMSLRGRAYGFEVDKDKSKKEVRNYTDEQIVDAIIEGLMMGVEPFHNKLMILAGRAYVRENGFRFLLNKVKDLKSYDVVCSTPRTSSNGALAESTVTWTLGDGGGVKTLTFPVKTDAFSTADQINGKCIRKSLKWLYSNLSSHSLPDEDEGIDVTRAAAIEVDVITPRIEFDEKPKDKVAYP